MIDRPRSGADNVTLRLTIFGILMVAAFVALFSRLWFLQVLAAGTYEELAEENRVRFVHSEPPRGRILDRNGHPLVENRRSLAVTLDRQVLDERKRRKKVLDRLSRLVDVNIKEIKERFNDGTVSPYKPVAVVNDINESAAVFIDENKEDFPGVGIEELPVRHYPNKEVHAPHIVGYVNEISPEQLKSGHFKTVRPPYAPGDIVGHSGVEYTYDRFLRGRPRIEKVIVNSSGEVIGSRLSQEERPGYDLMLAVDGRIQEVTEKALEAGIMAARGGGYQAPGGAAIVMDPTNGDVLAMSSFPDYNPRILADGITTKEFKRLNDPEANAWLNRAIQAQRQPGSTYKIVTAGAAMSTGVAGPYDAIECPGSRTFPPEGGPGSVTFNNWTSKYFGFIGFPTSLEVSCDTFYYELGWRMEERFGPPESRGGDGTERFQRYARRTGFDHETGIDLPNEAEGRVPDLEWCKVNKDIGYCPEGWYPGYTVNMAIGQGDLIVTPLQMAVAYAAIANGGTVWEPRVAAGLATTNDAGEVETVRPIKNRPAAQLPLDDIEIGVIREGLELVVGGANGTATGAFAGFPMDEFPIAGKTGTAELGETALNDAWFVAYGPTDAPEYVVSVYVERAGHGGESAAPIARQIFEGIFELDDVTDVQLGSDASG